MIVIGLTGGIGTGKTEVSKILRGLGSEIIDADLLGHEVYRPHTQAWREVVEAFGEDVLTHDGEVDRKRLGAIVFNDAVALKRLDSITHPRIFKMVLERIERLRDQGTKAVVVEAALLLEAGWSSLATEIWVTTVPEEEAIDRVRHRSGTDPKATRARIRSQMPQHERITRADVVVDNGGSLDDLREQVSKLWDQRVLAHMEKTH